jgi:transcriptional/translational regulatory protein YebC/TACO1
MAVKDAIENAGVAIEHAEVDNIPDTRIEVTDDDTASSVLKLVGALEELDDVQNVYANFDIPDEVIDRVGG